jgi:hypothetical protein
LAPHDPADAWNTSMQLDAGCNLRLRRYTPEAQVYICMSQTF